MVSEKQKKKLRSILEKISTLEEMKAFDMEVLSEKNDKTKREIIDEIKGNKPELGFISSLISRAEKIIGEKIDQLREEFNRKKYPVYNDEGLKNDIYRVKSELKDDIKMVNSFGKLSKDELVEIKNVLIELGKEIIKSGKDKETPEYIEALKGIAVKLNQIAAKSGFPEAIKLKDSSGTVFDPATEETLALIKAQTDKFKFNGDNLKTEGGGGGGGAVTNPSLDPTSNPPVFSVTTVDDNSSAVQLPDIPCKWMIIKPLPTNVGDVYLGDSSLIPGGGWVLSDPFAYDGNNTNLIYINADNNGDGVIVVTRN